MSITKNNIHHFIFVSMGNNNKPLSVESKIELPSQNWGQIISDDLLSAKKNMLNDAYQDLIVSVIAQLVQQVESKKIQKIMTCAIDLINKDENLAISTINDLLPKIDPAQNKTYIN